MKAPMTFQYMWLRILEALARGRRQMSIGELQQELGRRGLRIRDEEFAQGVRALREQGLVETLVLVGGGVETTGSIAITDRGERKVRGIIRF